jgi:putative sterol carrier protein
VADHAGSIGRRAGEQEGCNKSAGNKSARRVRAGENSEPKTGVPVTKWLSAEWFDQTRSILADQPGHAGLSARIQYEISGGPDGDIRYYCVLEDGRPTDRAGGTVPDPDVTLTVGWSDAAAVLRGELDPSVAFMQGRMKVAGSMGLMMRVLPVTTTRSYRELRREIASVTEF